MVTVRKLISELKKMPQTLPVGVAHHDNGDHEIAGWVEHVEVTTDDFNIDNIIKCVVLRC